ncbi:serine peptidase [Amycolatopsis thailandensis]|uniref:serine peptidase n=1 Tax=Amycolatopsis thailandensis TaxID=589330 RepID=UPI00364C0493
MNIVAVHGIGNYRPGWEPDDAARDLATEWHHCLSAGYTAAGLDNASLYAVNVAYYADLLAEPEAQGSVEELLGTLSPAEASLLRAWLIEVGVPEPQEAQGLLLAPLRQALDWLVQKRRVSIGVLTRIGVGLVREVHSYLTKPARRRAACEVVATAIEQHRPSVVLAHSLGSIVAYEALHAHPELRVDRFVTLGSPLGLPGGIFDALLPEPEGGMGAKPACVAKWINVADPSDLVALPIRLGDRFPVDRHATFSIGPFNFHKMGRYLEHPRTATLIANGFEPS